MNGTIDADDLLHDAGDRTDVVRNHDDGHPLVQKTKRTIEFVFETVVDEIGRLVENKQFRIGDDRPAKQGPLHLTARDFTDRLCGDIADAGLVEQTQRLRPSPFA